MIVARRFNAGADAEYGKVLKGRLNCRHVLPSVRTSIACSPSDVPSGLVALSHPGPGVKNAGLFSHSPSGTNFRRTEQGRKFSNIARIR
jgi:hypothetical protein